MLVFLNEELALPRSFRSLGHKFPNSDAEMLIAVASIASGCVPLVYPRRFEIAEIGSFVGLTTLLLAIYANPTHIHAIDTWEGAEDCPQAGVNTTYRDLGGDAVYRLFKENISPYSHIITHYRWPSLLAAERLDQQFDMVFIDGDHSYSAVSSDIDAWSPKVRPNGVLCGHDYRCFEGVTKAVEERPHLRTTLPSSIWYWQKPEEA